MWTFRQFMSWVIVLFIDQNVCESDLTTVIKNKKRVLLCKRNNMRMDFLFGFFMWNRLWLGDCFYFGAVLKKRHHRNPVLISNRSIKRMLVGDLIWEDFRTNMTWINFYNIFNEMKHHMFTWNVVNLIIL